MCQKDRAVWERNVAVFVPWCTYIPFSRKRNKNANMCAIGCSSSNGACANSGTSTFQWRSLPIRKTDVIAFPMRYSLTSDFSNRPIALLVSVQTSGSSAWNYLRSSSVVPFTAPTFHPARAVRTSSYYQLILLDADRWRFWQKVTRTPILSWDWFRERNP